MISELLAIYIQKTLFRNHIIPNAAHRTITIAQLSNPVYQVHVAVPTFAVNSKPGEIVNV